MPFTRQILEHPHGRLTLSLLCALLSRAALAQPSPPGPNTDPYGGSFSPSMGVIIIVLIAALFFMGFFSIYIRHCSDGSSSSSSAAVRRALATGSVARSRRAPRGLDPAVVAGFPTFDYAAVRSLKIGKGALECAVCLTEFEDDDTLRLIPKCDHVFHPDCIDPWLAAHVTCPVCRTNLVPDDVDEAGPADGGPAPDLEAGAASQINNINTEGILIGDSGINSNPATDSMEEPLQGHSRRLSRNRTMKRLLGRLARSFSTGHVAVKQWESFERFTLRLPEEVRKQVMSGKLERSTSVLVLPRETSSRRGYRSGSVSGPGFGEGSSSVRRGGRFSRSDRWVFSLLRAPPFFSMAPSLRSPKVAAAATSGSRQGSLRGNIADELSRVPV